MNALVLLLAVLGQTVFSFADPAIDESSGLVDLGSLMVTTNDSGGDPLVFVVDPRSGRTVGHTTFTSQTVDVEALAPAGAHAIWVADIGDNTEQRDSVQVYRVPVGRGDRTVDAPAYELRYPDGSHDAESLVAAPSGQLYVITKGILGGTVYAAPRHLDAARPNTLRPVASVDIWATDAALFPDGQHVLVRGYDSAAVYTFPGFRPVAAFDLPREKQGEGVSIGRSGRVRLSSEGQHSAVLEVPLPAAVHDLVEGAAVASASAAATASPTPTPHRRTVSADESGPTVPKAPVVGAALLVVVTTAVGVLVARRKAR